VLGQPDDEPLAKRRHLWHNWLMRDNGPNPDPSYRPPRPGGSGRPGLIGQAGVKPTGNVHRCGAASISGLDALAVLQIMIIVMLLHMMLH
jgi:hypothetical protein